MLKKFLLLQLLQCFLLAGYGSDTLTVYAKPFHDGSTDVMVINDHYITCTVVIEYMPVNMAPDAPMTDTVTIAARSTKRICTLTPVNRAGRWTYSYRYRYWRGDHLTATHPDSIVYELPFSSGNCIRVGQGYNGSFSHLGKMALDFTMPEGTQVLAARAGTVYQVKKDSESGCPEPACAGQANYVRIAHDDGSVAEYFHLRRDGVTVKPGQKVQPGQLIGYSGNTGFSSQPHLHFEVWVPERINMQYRTVPITFLVSGEKKALVRGDCVSTTARSAPSPAR